MAEQKSGKVHQATHSSRRTSGHNTIYSYNHQNPHGPFAPGKIPKPIMILGGLMLFGSIYSFITASTQSTGWISFFSIVVGMIDILLAIGLLMRLEVARKTLIYLSIAAIVLIPLSGISVHKNFRDLDALNASANNKIAEVRQQPLSATQEVKVQELEDAVIDTNRQTLLLKKRMVNVYIYWGFVVLAHAGIVFYLTRPNVKSEFRKLQ